MERNELNQRLPGAVERLLKSVHELPHLRRLNRGVLPSRENAEACVEQMLQILYPGFYGRQGLTTENLPFRLGELATGLADTLYDHVRFCLRFKQGTDRPGDRDLDQKCEQCDRDAARIVADFLDRLPAVRAMLSEDVEAAFESDPAATSTDETIFCYPGLLAISVQRLAHELYKLDVPLLPRVWTEIAHSRTGIDIHPGAKLGRRCFIDHGTGVVIGETCEIGDNVKIYQGVTLGALAPAFGQTLRGQKRHPTIEDDVVIYAGTTILGGETVIGKGSTIGGNVFLTHSVAAGNVVAVEQPKLKLRERGKKKPSEPAIDFDI